MTTLHTFLMAHPDISKALYAGLSGLGGAVVIDVKVFLRDSSWSQFMTDWSFKVASYRYLQGFVGSIIVAFTGTGVATLFGF